MIAQRGVEPAPVVIGFDVLEDELSHRVFGQAVEPLLCAAESFNDMEDFGKAKADLFKTFLKLRNGIPSHNIFNRVFAAHLEIENRLHWVMYVCFCEDQSRARSGYAAENLATLRRLALNLPKREKPKSAAFAANNSTPAGTTPTFSSS
jgi:predicted transposase YbfD/YdcC